MKIVNSCFFAPLLAFVLVGWIFPGGGQSVTTTINDAGEEIPVEKGKLVYWHLFGGSDAAWMDKIVESYNATNPAKQIQIIPMPTDFYTKLYTAVAAGKGPDVASVHDRQIAYLRKEGIINAVDDYAAGAKIDWSKYSDRANDSVTFDGKHFAIPLDTLSELFIINVDKFKAAGIPLTNNQVSIKSPEEFKAILDKLKPVMGEGESVIACTQTGMDPFRVFAHVYFQMGGPNYITVDKASMDKPIAIRAANYIKSLFDGGYILPGQADHQKLFQAGQAAIFFGGTWSVGVLKNTQGLNIGVQPFPIMFGKSAYWGASHNLVMPVRKSRNAADSQGAVDFMYWASSVGGIIWADSGQIPANAQVRSTPEYQALPFAKNYADIVDSIMFLPKTPGSNFIFNIMTQNLDLVWNGQNDPGVAVDGINKQLQDLIDNQ
ncbi:MAG: extracellular solute-binding protein [Spirochaetaceae bacterium]|jgi:multiple sugar transport system substrate-binding protein|nr:extracellular solute-binding protein [Spirochaetaceae bacterium]